MDKTLWPDAEPNNNCGGQHYGVAWSGKIKDARKNEDQKFFGFICEWEPGSRYAKIAPKLAKAIKEMEPEEDFKELKISKQVADKFQANKSNYPQKMNIVLKKFFLLVAKADSTYQNKYKTIAKLQDKKLQSIQRAQTKALDCLQQQVTSDSVEKAKVKVQEFAQQAEKPICVDELYRVHFQGSSYLNMLSSVTWTQAQKMCSEMGGHLVYIETIEERDFLADTIAHGSSPWVGATDKHKEGDWRLAEP